MYTCIYGADTETLRGQPHTLQFYSEDVDCNEIIWVDEHTALDATLDWCKQRRKDCVHVVYCHNLQFDLPEFLYGAHELLIEPGGMFDFEVGNWRIRGCYGAPTFCRMSHKDKRRRILFVDSFLWFQGSLAAAAKLFCPDLPKLKMPKGLGEKKFSIRDDNFAEYAMRDAEVAYHIGKTVQQIHQEFSIQQSVSLADMSAKIFRHHFLDYTIPQPKESVIFAALQSYHGGKNNVIPNACPRWHMSVNALDISSAYPYAMAQLPSFQNKRAYKRIVFRNGHVPKHVPECGIYRVSGCVSECKWPSLFNHSFNPLRGKFSNIWIHGMEVNESLRAGELKIDKIYGHIYDRQKSEKHEPALKAYVNDFYKRKQSEKDPVLRYMYKLILNSLYGKFIQTRKSMRQEYYEIDPMDLASLKQSEYMELRAGGMFHPFIASSITAHTRAYLHQIEHKYKAIHTATDGIFTASSSKSALRGYPRTGLGSLTSEGKGDLVLLRNKCYILYGKQSDKTLKSQYFRGKHIIKYAKHGFQGTVYDLEKCIAHNKRKYTVNKPNRLRQSIQRGLQVNEFVKRDMVLKVAPIQS